MLRSYLRLILFTFGLLLAWVMESVLLLLGAAAGLGRSKKVQQRHRL